MSKIVGLYDTMNRTSESTIGLVMAILLCSCASTPDDSQIQGYLATHIMDDGSKHFVYTIDYPPGGIDGQKTNSNGRPGNTTGHIYGNSSRGVAGGVTLGSGNSKSGGRKGGGRQRSGKSQPSRQAHINLRLDEMLAMELRQTGFCRGDYMELERLTRPPDVLLRGECDETATTQDRADFPNK